MLRSVLSLSICLALLAGCSDSAKKSKPELPPGHHLAVAELPSLPRGLGRGAPVRIAGVDVGRVWAIRLGKPVLVELDIEPKGWPLRRDAEVKVRPRIFQEGAYFVDLQPGTPGAAPLPEGAHIHGSKPLTSEQVLRALQHTRPGELKRFLKRYAKRRAQQAP